MVLAPVRHRLHAAPKAFANGPDVNRKPSPPAARTEVRKAEKIEGRGLRRIGVPRQRRAPKRQQPRLLGVKRQAILRESLGQHCQDPLRILAILKAKNEGSRPGELHPQALVEPYVIVSAHTAPSLRPPGRSPNKYQWANSRGSRPATPTSQWAARRWCRRSRLYFRMAQRTSRSLR
jgi:hypothetical protein